MYSTSNPNVSYVVPSMRWWRGYVCVICFAILYCIGMFVWRMRQILYVCECYHLDLGFLFCHVYVPLVPIHSRFHFGLVYWPCDSYASHSGFILIDSNCMYCNADYGIGNFRLKLKYKTNSERIYRNIDSIGIQMWTVLIALISAWMVWTAKTNV